MQALALSRQCEAFGTLPLAGGLWDQPVGVMADLSNVRRYEAVYSRVANDDGSTEKLTQSERNFYGPVMWFVESGERIDPDAIEAPAAREDEAYE